MYQIDLIDLIDVSMLTGNAKLYTYMYLELCVHHTHHAFTCNYPTCV